MKLYYAFSKIDYKGRKNVLFSYFAHDRECTKRYKKAIDYDVVAQDDRSKMYAEGYINELFTKAEVEELRKYMKEKHNAEIEIKTVDLPIKEQMMPFEAIAVGGGNDFYMMNREDGYNLSIKIWAYYDLDNCEYPAGQSRLGELRELMMDLEKLDKKILDLNVIVRKALDDAEIQTLRDAKKAIDDFRNAKDDIPF